MDLMTLAEPALTEHFGMLAERYDVILCDVWGVVHNSIVAAPSACDALLRFRARGGTVILITNAPRPGATVLRQLDSLGVSREAYDDIVSSGDVTRALIARRDGQAALHIGPDRDLGIFTGLALQFADAQAADYIVCTGLFDDDAETPDDYRKLLSQLRSRELFMICANPDLVVERGTKLIYCAGAIADLYQSQGGEVLYAGKPHPPIYEEALAKAAARRDEPIARNRVIAIGDSIRTDIKGAVALGIDCVFVTAGIHAEELGPRDNPDVRALRRLFAEAGTRPTAVMRELVW
jgi:HAD superfamily hydrolase (TIGR01459 family)